MRQRGSKVIRNKKNTNHKAVPKQQTQTRETPLCQIILVVTYLVSIKNTCCYTESFSYVALISLGIIKLNCSYKLCRCKKRVYLQSFKIKQKHGFEGVYMMILRISFFGRFISMMRHSHKKCVSTLYEQSQVI